MEREFYGYRSMTRIRKYLVSVLVFLIIGLIGEASPLMARGNWGSWAAYGAAYRAIYRQYPPRSPHPPLPAPGAEPFAGQTTDGTGIRPSPPPERDVRDGKIPPSRGMSDMR